MLGYFSRQSRAFRKIRKAAHEVQIMQDQLHFSGSRNPDIPRLRQYELVCDHWMPDPDPLTLAISPDGRRIFFNPYWVLKASQEEIIREFHALLP